MKISYFLIVLLTVSTAISFNGMVIAHDDDDHLQIVTSTSLIADWVSNIVGDEVHVDYIIPNGVDPHDYNPTAADITKLQEADFVFFIGGGFEEGLEDTLEELEVADKALALFEAIPEKYHLDGDGDHAHDDDHDDHDHSPLSPLNLGEISSIGVRNGDDDHHHDEDPHFWTNSELVEISIYNITSILVDLDPDHASIFESNRDTYLDKLHDLHHLIEDEVEKLSDDQKYLVTTHLSMNYFAKEFGFKVFSLQGISTSTEAGLAELEHLAEELEEHEIEVIFVESTSTDTGAQALIAAAAAIGWTVVIGGVLYVESLDDDDAPTYIDMITHNALTIVGSILNPPTGEERGLNYPLSFLFLGLSIIAISIARRFVKH
jgi:manganese/zinc/iron transport system substrate-binding protein